MSFNIDMLNDMVLKAEAGQTILDASLKAGVPHYHVCGGNARCSTCRIIVQEGAANITLPNKAELKMRKRKKYPENIRLACQTKVISGNVKVQRIIKDDTDLNLYVYSDYCENIQTVGEEKPMALFFLDIRNFTPFLEQHLPFDVIHIIRRLNILFNEKIESNKGKILEYSGDGFYAVFGFDEEIQSAVNNAYNAGREILKSLDILNQTYIKKYFDHEITIGIGLHAGKVIVGKTGVTGNNLYTVMGIPVNIASRLESSTKELNNNFIVSDYAYRFLNESNTAECRKINLKGVSEPFEVRLMGEEY